MRIQSMDSLDQNGKRIPLPDHLEHKFAVSCRNVLTAIYVLAFKEAKELKLSEEDFVCNALIACLANVICERSDLENIHSNSNQCIRVFTKLVDKIKKDWKDSE